MRSKRCSFSLLAASALGVGLVMPGFTNRASATVLYSDSFTAADGTADSGRSPDVTVAPAFAGNLYTGQGNTFYDTTQAKIFSNRAQLGADDGEALPFAADSDFATLGTTQFTLSVGLDTGSLGTGSSPQRGIGLGFYTTAPFTSSSGGAGFNGFLGLTTAGDGALDLVSGSSPSDPTANPTVNLIATATIPTFSSGTTQTLAYDIDSSTGAISNVIFDGSPVTLNFGSNSNNLFTNSAIQYVGFTSKGSTSFTNTGFVDNFSVASAVPEPGSLGLMIGAAGLMLGRRRKS
jgi:hypothetical protein